MSVNDEVTSLLRYENRLQREIVKELGFVSLHSSLMLPDMAYTYSHAHTLLKSRNERA